MQSNNTFRGLQCACLHCPFIDMSRTTSQSDYLLCYSTWDSYLCKEAKLYANAVGLLRSYFHLVKSRSDLRIAHENSLLPTEITWQRWSIFSRAALPNCHISYCNRRYRYAELSAARLTWIWRFRRIRRFYRQPSDLQALMDDYCQARLTTASGYMQKKTKWLLGALIYITIVLTAMQVGLGTDRLSQDRAFQKASYGFTLFSILAPLAVLFASLAKLMVYLGLEEVGKLNRKSMSEEGML